MWGSANISFCSSSVNVSVFKKCSSPKGHRSDTSFHELACQSEIETQYYQLLTDLLKRQEDMKKTQGRSEKKRGKKKRKAHKHTDRERWACIVTGGIQYNSVVYQ